MVAAQKHYLGIIHIGPVILAALVLLVGALALISPKAVRKKVDSVIKARVSHDEVVATLPETPTQTPIPTPSPTVWPTPTPTNTPTPKPTPVPKAVSGPAAQEGPPSSGHSRITVTTQRGSFLIDVVSMDMTAGVRMITDTASDSDCFDNCPTLPLADYVARNGGFAGMNGTYFCPTDYADCAAKKNSFDFPAYNTRLGKWINAGNLFWNNRSIIYYDGSGLHFLRNANSFGGGLSSGIVNHPGLLDGGSVIAETFGLSEKQASKGTKSGIGIRGNVVYLVIARSVDMLDLAHVFKSLGATHALNLDGGGSVALWFGGYKVGPGRSLPNAVIFAR